MVLLLILSIVFYVIRSFVFHVYKKFSLISLLCSNLYVSQAFANNPQAFIIVYKIFGFLSLCSIFFFIKFSFEMWSSRVVAYLILVVLYMAINWIVRINAEASAIDFYKKYLKDLIKDDIVEGEQLKEIAKVLSLSSGDFYNYTMAQVKERVELLTLVKG